MLREELSIDENAKTCAIKTFIEKTDLTYFDGSRFEKFSAETEVITWEEIEKWVNQLAEKIKGKNYSGLYGIPRGGLIIACLLSYKTSLPLLLAPTKNCLVVDDDLGSGTTLLQYIGRYDTAVMFRNPHCSLKPTYLYQDYSEAFRAFIWNVN